MAFYSPVEIKEILLKLAEQPASEVNYIKFERLGILVDQEVDLSPNDNNNDELLYACSVCKKKLISAHLLDLHVTETHDSYFDIQKEKKSMVSCGVNEFPDLSLN